MKIVLVLSVVLFLALCAVGYALSNDGPTYQKWVDQRQAHSVCPGRVGC